MRSKIALLCLLFPLVSGSLSLAGGGGESSAFFGKNWVSQDKVSHFMLSTWFAFGSFYVYREGFNNAREGSYFFSGGLTISLGALKEYYDSRHPRRHQASWGDFAADLAGTGAGLALAYLLIN